MRELSDIIGLFVQLTWSIYQLDDEFKSFVDALLEEGKATEAKMNQYLICMRLKPHLTSELKLGNPEKSKLPFMSKINT